jgi:hypothetical protein
LEHYIDIPESFFSDGEGKPFETCLKCGKNLLEDNVTYVVEKAMTNTNDFKFSSTVYEFAICTECHLEMQNRMSKESVENLNTYYQDKIAEIGKQSVAIDLRSFDVKQWLSKCFFTDKPVQEMKEYQIVAQFRGKKMLLNMPPMVIGEEIMEEMAAVISTKTKEEMDGFREQFLGPPPEFEEFIYGRRLIFV